MTAPNPTLGAGAARQLANTTKTAPQWIGTTPRWLVSLLPWTPVEAGTYRVNQVKEGGEDNIGIECSPSDGDQLPHAFVDYAENPREYTLSTVTTIIDIQTRISDLYRSPMDQVREQLSVLIDMVKERQERELINNPNYGLLSHAIPSQRISTRKGPPTPDDLDELITKVWKEPAFFLAHPKAIAAFGRECTRRGVPPPTTTLFGSPFLTWRGLPLIPSDKLDITQKRRAVLCVARVCLAFSAFTAYGAVSAVRGAQPARWHGGRPGLAGPRCWWQPKRRLRAGRRLRPRARSRSFTGRAARHFRPARRQT